MPNGPSMDELLGMRGESILCIMSYDTDIWTLRLVQTLSTKLLMTSSRKSHGMQKSNR